jgi:hypothetical protein
MLNDTARDPHAMGWFSETLPLFEAALGECQVRRAARRVRTARRSAPRCRRSLKRLEPALAIPRSLEAE